MWLYSVHWHHHHFWLSTTQLVEVGMPTLVCQTEPRPEDLGIRGDALLTTETLNRCILKLFMIYDFHVRMAWWREVLSGITPIDYDGASVESCCNWRLLHIIWFLPFKLECHGEKKFCMVNLWLWNLVPWLDPVAIGDYSTWPLTMVKTWSIATGMMMYSDLGRTDPRTSRDALLVEFPHRRSRWRSRIRGGGPRRPQRQ